MSELPINSLKSIDPKTVTGFEGVYIQPAASLKHTVRDFNGHLYRQPNVKNEQRLRSLQTNASLLLTKIININVEGGKLSVFTDKEGGLCGMCQSQKFVNIPLNGTATLDGGKGQISVESVVDAANNIVVAIKDASGSNPLVLLYQMREFNMVELVICPAGQEPMVFNYEKPNFF